MNNAVKRKVGIIICAIIALLALSVFVGQTAPRAASAEETCLHEYDETTGTPTCTKCGTALVAKAESDGNITYHESFAAAVAVAESNNSSTATTIMLLADTEFSTFTEKRVILDINGKKLTGSVGSVNGLIIEFKDSAGGGVIEGNDSLGLTFNNSTVIINPVKITGSSIYFYNCKLTVNGGEIDANLGVSTDNDPSTTINGGIIKKMYFQGKPVAVNGGEIKNLIVQNEQRVISGGTLDAVDFSSCADGTMAGLITEGRAYARADDGTPIKIADLVLDGSRKWTTPVNVIECTHGEFNPATHECLYCGTNALNPETNECLYCGITAAVELTKSDISGDTVSHYTSFEEAIANVEDFGSIKILDDIEICGFENKSVTINLNGKTVTTSQNVEITSSSTDFYSHEISLTDETGKGEWIANGSITFRNVRFNALGGKISNGTADGKVIFWGGAINASKSDFATTLSLQDGARAEIAGGAMRELYVADGVEANIFRGTINVLRVGALSPMLMGETVSEEKTIVNSIVFDEGVEKNYVGLLKKGYAYVDAKNDTFVKLTDMSESKAVRILPCEHGEVDDNYICLYCGNQMTVKVKNEGESGERYYGSFSEASYNVKDGGLMTLIGDTDLMSFAGVSFTMDLNGHTLNYALGTIQFSGISFTLKDSAGGGKLLLKSGLIEFVDATFTFVSGSIDLEEGASASIRMSAGNLNLQGGAINVPISVSATLLSLSGGSIKELNSNAAIDFTKVIADKCAYKNASGYVKRSDVTTLDGITIVECEHTAFEKTGGEFICVYCGYQCEHLTFDKNGFCAVCQQIECKHEQKDEHDKCVRCKNDIIAEVLSSDGTTKYYINFVVAATNFADGDKVTILNGTDIAETCVINKKVVVDLNGKKIDGYNIQTEGEIRITDSVGGGEMHIEGKSGATGVTVVLEGKKNTRFLINDLYGNLSVKMYGGSIYHFVSGVSVRDVLPEGYRLVKIVDGTGEEKALKWAETDGLTTISAGDGYSVTSEVCTHPEMDDNLICTYCNKTLTEKEAITILQTRLTAAENELIDVIATKVDQMTFNQAMSSFTDTINSIQDSYRNADDSLKEQLEAAIAAAEKRATDAANGAIEAAKTELLDKINKKASTDDLNNAITSLNAAIEKAEAMAKAYADSQDGKLKEELTASIATAKEEAIAAANTELNKAKTELLDRIGAKASSEDLTKAINDLNAAIETAKTTANAYADSQDGKLKEELTASIATAKEEAIAAANAELNKAKKELLDQIGAKASTDDLNNAITSLNDAIEKAEAMANAYADSQDEILKDALTASIATAKDEAIAAANTELNKAKKELLDQIGAKASSEDLNNAITSLNDAIEKAEAMAKAYADSQDGKIKEELTASIATAKSEAIAAANTALAEAQEALAKATKAEEDISVINEALSSLNETIRSASTVNEAYVNEKDDEVKQELTEAIATAKGEAIAAANRNIDAAKAELNEKISEKASEEELKAAIKSLNTAIINAENASKAYSASNNSAAKDELEKKITAAKTELSGSIKELNDRVTAAEKSVEETAKKTKTLQTLVIVFFVLMLVFNAITTVVLILWRRKK